MNYNYHLEILILHILQTPDMEWAANHEAQYSNCTSDQEVYEEHLEHIRDIRRRLIDSLVEPEPELEPEPAPQPARLPIATPHYYWHPTSYTMGDWADDEVPF
jgi:hypothetical protein